jgi:serine/threonine protein kinase
VAITGSDQRLAGLVVLGEKKSEEPYTPKDQKLLHAIARQMAVVRENLRLKERVGEGERIKHEVLARLDRTLLNLLKECPRCGVCFDSSVEICDRDGQVLTLTLPIERTIDGRYRVDRLIGRGGMRAVYEAFDERLDRRIAVKILMGGGLNRDTAVRRFEREARAVARLDHRNVVAIHDYGVLPPDGAYLVMECIHGITLRTEIDMKATLPPVRAADWFDQLLDGLIAAHAGGVIHRDLKPENIIADTSSEQFVVKILDFGLAKVRPLEAATKTGLTAEGLVMGTFGYMAPEQLCGTEIDQRTDIFAVGVIVAECLTGQRPFSGNSYTEVLRSVLHDDYRLPGTSAESERLSAVLSQCLSKDPATRTSSAMMLRRDLIPALRACPASIWSLAAGDGAAKTV